jgi:hypothetical protein
MHKNFHVNKLKQENTKNKDFNDMYKRSRNALSILIAEKNKDKLTPEK